MRIGTSIALATMFVGGFAAGAVWRDANRPQAGIIEESGYAPSPGFRVPIHELDYYVPDPVAGHVHRPFARRDYPWPEHPRNEVHFAANNLGLRHDHDTARERPAGTYRILFTGDSHIDGVVYDASETMPEVVERLLEAGTEPQDYEALNAAAGYYGPHNYRGVIDRFLFLDPQMYVVVLHTGNDFIDAVKTGKLRGEIDDPERSADYGNRLQQASDMDSGAVGQSVNSLYYFKTFPAQQDAVLDVSFEQLRGAYEVCHRRGIQMVLVLLPTKCDLEWTRRTAVRGLADNMCAVLGLGPDDLQINRRLGLRLAERLRAIGVLVVDPYERMFASRKPLFWDTDSHLNTDGHAMIAAELVAEVGPKIREQAKALAGK